MRRFARFPVSCETVTERSQVARVNAVLASGNLTMTGGMFPKRWSLATGGVFGRGLPSASH